MWKYKHFQTGNIRYSSVRLPHPWIEVNKSPDLTPAAPPSDDALSGILATETLTEAVSAIEPDTSTPDPAPDFSGGGGDFGGGGSTSDWS